MDEDSRSWGNYSDSISPANVSGYGSPQDTGYSEYWSANKIYDLAGNYYDFTQEVYYTSFRFYGGGYYGTSGSFFPGSARGGIGSNNANSEHTARATLIISDTVS